MPSPDRLVDEGYLPQGAIADVPAFPEDKVDYGWVIDYKNKLLRQAFDHFQQYGRDDQRSAQAELVGDDADGFGIFADAQCLVFFDKAAGFSVAHVIQCSQGFIFYFVYLILTHFSSRYIGFNMPC